MFYNLFDINNTKIKIKKLFNVMSNKLLKLSHVRRFFFIEYVFVYYVNIHVSLY